MQEQAVQERAVWRRSRRPRDRAADPPSGGLLGRTWIVSPDLLGILDQHGFFEATNPAWQATLGWSADQLRTTPFLDFVHPEDRDKTLTVWREVRANQPALRFENRYRTRTGDWRWLSWVAVLEVDKIYCSARDIHSQKEQSAALARTVAERDRIMRNSRDLITVIDMSGRLLSVNEATGPVLGWRPDEMIGRAVMDFIHPDHRPPLASDGQLIAERYREPRIFLNRFVCKDGSYRWMSWSAVTEDGLIYSQGRDVTAEREQAAALQSVEESLRQSQKMEAVGQLTGGIAHDFNNLLAGITGSLEMVLRRIEDGRVADVDRHVTAALGAARRAAALTHRLLAFSRRQALAPQAVDINRLLGEILDLTRRTVGPSITVERIAAPGLWATHVDANQLENAILNLCINARDAMPCGGRITLETANRWLDDGAARGVGLPPGGYVAIRVSDTGIGMSPEIANKAFEPFFTTKPLGQGTGLGLSMVYGFVRQSGGQVQIESQPGCGTTLRLYLPRHLGEVATSESAVPVERRRGGGRGRTVVVIDDEPTVRSIVQEVLTEAGFSVLTAENGVSGLKVLESPTRIDLLVTDVGLPGELNGRQVADAARVRRPAIKVLFITGYAETAVIGNDDLGVGMSILTKPFEVKALEGRVLELLSA